MLDFHVHMFRQSSDYGGLCVAILKTSRRDGSSAVKRAAVAVQSLQVATMEGARAEHAGLGFGILRFGEVFIRGRAWPLRGIRRKE